MFTLVGNCVKGPDKAQHLLKKCESRIKAQLPNPNTYRKIRSFETLHSLTTETKEAVDWKFIYEGLRDGSIVSQTRKAPTMKADAICFINKETQEVETLFLPVGKYQ